MEAPNVGPPFFVSVWVSGAHSDTGPPARWPAARPVTCLRPDTHHKTMFFGNTLSHFSSTDCDANTIRGPRLRRGRPKWPAHNWCQRWWLVVGGGLLASDLAFLLPIWEWPLSDSPSIDYGETPIRITVCKSWLMIVMMGSDAHRRPVRLSQSLCIWSTNHALQLRTPSPTATAATATSRWPRSKANAWLTHMAACRRCYPSALRASLLCQIVSSTSSPVPSAIHMDVHTIVVTNVVDQHQGDQHPATGSSSSGMLKPSGIDAVRRQPLLNDDRGLIVTAPTTAAPHDQVGRQHPTRRGAWFHESTTNQQRGDDDDDDDKNETKNSDSSSSSSSSTISSSSDNSSCTSSSSSRTCSSSSRTWRSMRGVIRGSICS
ncbi:uncharacterized protein LOC122381973 [Amphibalanus amphitrite]|uniref:uncharacterized protein LOC122381973 n=1 Tax=Amphibalanus amphitrite TaxID=1232801 RepID=UPI001C90709C|nr:uncharacterized protein LOC122381973 [Amphibalanus amphitrite]